MARKNNDAQETLLTREQKAINEAKELIESRMPKVDYGAYSFMLKTGKQLFIKPKCEFIASDGYKLKIRYHEMFNSIFEPYQEYDIDEGLELGRIGLKSPQMIKDRVLLDYLLIYPSFGKKYRLIDPAGDAEKELSNFNKVHDVWSKVVSMQEDKLQAILLLKTDHVDLSKAVRPTMLLTIQNMIEHDPEGMAEAIVDPRLETIFLYHAASKFKIIRQNKNTGSIVWADTGKEICKVPANIIEPSKYFAKLMLEDGYSNTRNLLEEKINGQ